MGTVPLNERVVVNFYTGESHVEVTSPSDTANVKLVISGPRRAFMVGNRATYEAISIHRAIDQAAIVEIDNANRTAIIREHAFAEAQGIYPFVFVGSEQAEWMTIRKGLNVFVLTEV